MLLSSNFGSALAQYDPETAPATLFVATVLLLLLLWPILQEKKQAIKYVFLLFPLLVLWKYSVGRQDAHIMAAVQVVIPLAVLLYISRESKRQVDVAMLCVTILLVTLAVFANKIPYQQEFARTFTAPATNIRTHGFVAFFRVDQQKMRWERVSGLRLQKAALPATMRQVIGARGVDIFPWETNIVAANNLTWQNRPSPFSFQSYDPYLDNMNARFFGSAKAPPFIVWHHVGTSGVESVDFRHVLWDEPATFRAILTNYEFIESSAEFMLLQKRTKPLVWGVKEIVLQAQYGSEFTLPDTDGLTFVDLIVKSDVFQAVVGQLVRGKVYGVNVRDAQGTEVRYRFVREMGGQGFIISDLPKDWEGLVALMQNVSLPVKTKTITMPDVSSGVSMKLRVFTPGQ
jgi:hypothetical protein